jgi:signal transduction histidine kinase
MVAEHILLVPLLSQGKTVATLGASRVRAERFDDEALAILQQIGSVAVLALRNARLFEARRDFMNMAAHELRTPLTVLHGYLSMLRDGTFGPPSQRWDQPLQVMAGKIDDLSRLVDDLLIGARLERGAARSEPRALDLVGLAVAAVERARPRVALLGGHLELQAGEQAVPVVADPDDVERILDNLLNNALTYSATAPRVVVRVESDVACVRIAVEDHGRGIPAALHERVFEQFFRIDDRKLGYPLGTGLGLYISRQLAEAQGGGLRIARSAPGEGSVFVLELPRPPAVA